MSMKKTPTIKLSNSEPKFSITRSEHEKLEKVISSRVASIITDHRIYKLVESYVMQNLYLPNLYVLVDYLTFKERFYKTYEIYGDDMLYFSIVDQFGDDLLKLTKIISKYYTFDNHREAQYTTWRMLNILAMKEREKNFDVVYKDVAESVGKISIEDSLKEFAKKIISYEDEEIDLLILTNRFLHLGMIDADDDINAAFKLVKKTFSEAKELNDLDRFEQALLNRNTDSENYTIEIVDIMNGHEFEEFLVGVFRNMGYRAEKTAVTGDQGIDIILEKESIKIGVQAKCYSRPVSNVAIQEAVAGLRYYHLDKVMVVTNSTFTQAALKLAKSNNVILWDRNALIDKMEILY